MGLGFGENRRGIDGGKGRVEERLIVSEKRSYVSPVGGGGGIRYVSS